MPAAKKSPAVAKKAPPAVRPPKPGVLVAAEAVLAVLGPALDAFDKELAAVAQFDAPLPQALIYAAGRFDEAASRFNARLKKFAEAAVARRNNPDAFGAGAACVTFNETTRRAPKWKEVAIEQARLNVGDDFKPEAFVNDVVTATAPTTSVSVTVKFNGE